MTTSSKKYNLYKETYDAVFQIPVVYKLKKENKRLKKYIKQLERVILQHQIGSLPDILVSVGQS